MTSGEFANCLQALVTEANDVGLDLETIAAGLAEAAEACREALS